MVFRGGPYGSMACKAIQKYKAEHKEELREMNQKYELKRKQKQQEWLQKNTKKQQDYRETNKERLQQLVKSWKSSNKE